MAEKNIKTLGGIYEELMERFNNIASNDYYNGDLKALQNLADIGQKMAAIGREIRKQKKAAEPRSPK